MNSVTLCTSLVVLLSALSRVSRADQHCWPDNETETCFASIPPELISWPSQNNDYYVSKQEEVVDLGDYTISQVQKDPRDFCQYKNEILTAVSCLSNATASRCPHLPSEMMVKHQRMGLAMDNFCAEVDNIDPLCLVNHWQATMACHDQIMPKKGMRTTTSGFSEPEPEKEDWKQHDGPNMDEESSNRMICWMKYQMMVCMRKSLTDCDGKTAQVMAQFFQDMSSKKCVSLMEMWKSSQQSDGATGLSVAWATALSSASFLFALHGQRV